MILWPFMMIINKNEKYDSSNSNVELAVLGSAASLISFPQPGVERERCRIRWAQKQNSREEPASILHVLPRCQAGTACIVCSTSGRTLQVLCLLALCRNCHYFYPIFFVRTLDTCIVIAIVIVIGGLKSRGLTKTYIMCSEKISPIEILTIPGLSILRADQ